MARSLTAETRGETEKERSESRSMWIGRVRPSFALYLAALGLFPFKWLSPFSYQQAGWTDVLMAAAVLARLLEGLLHSERPRLRSVHLLLGAYFLTVLLSAIVAHDRTTAAQNVLITGELIAIALLTADFARSDSGLKAITRVVFGVSLVAAIEAIVGLILFYAGDSTSLVAGYSGYFKTSHLYTRVAAGFYSPPLLGSFCIFASAVFAMDRNGLPRRLRVGGQVLLALLVVSTVSRPAIAFAMAIALREANRRSTVRARRVATGSLIVGCLTLAALSLVPLTLDPLRPSSSTSDTNPRLALIESATRSLANHPLVGTGPGTVAASWQGEPLRAHFTPLNIAVTTGLPSLVLLSWLIAVLWRRRRRPIDFPLWTGALALGIDGLTQDVEHFRHTWMILGLLDADGARAGNCCEANPEGRAGGFSSAHHAEVIDRPVRCPGSDSDTRGGG
jgi:O-Antigen ligase